MANAQILLVNSGTLTGVAANLLNGVGTLVEYTGTQSPDAYDLLVVDAGSVALAQFGPVAALVRTALTLEKPLPTVVLNPTAAHKKLLAAAKALRSYLQEDSEALLIESQRDAGGRIRLKLTEHFAAPNAKVTRVKALAGANGRPAAASEVDDVPVTPQSLQLLDVTPFVARVREAVIHRKAPPAVNFALGAPTSVSPDTPPPTIPVGLYDVTPMIVYYTVNLSGAQEGGYTPASQVQTLEGMFYAGIYYDNTSSSQPTQWVLLQFMGQFSAGNLVANSNSTLGWTIGELSIQGTYSGSNVSYPQCSPAPVSNASTYTSSVSFNVGLSIGTDGLPQPTTYTIAQSQTNALTGWQINPGTAGPLSWDFFQSTPYPGNTPTTQWPNGMVDANGICGVPTISTTQLNAVVQAVCTQPATQTSNNATFTFTTQSWFAYSAATGKHWQGYDWGDVRQNTLTCVIDGSAAWPAST